MAADSKGKPIASANDFAILSETPEGQRIMDDLRAQFETNQPNYRTAEVLENPASADTFAKLRDGAREVIQYLEIQSKSPLSNKPQ